MYMHISFCTVFCANHFVLVCCFAFINQIRECLLPLWFTSNHAGDDGVALRVGLVHVGGSCCSSEISLGPPTF